MPATVHIENGHYDWLEVLEQAGHPATPPAGKWRLYTRAAGLFTISPAGVVSGPFGAGSGTPAGADTQVQFNNSGAFGGSANLTWNSSTNALAVTGAISATAASATAVPLTLSGAASQSANLSEWKNNAGTVLAALSKDGYLGLNTAPSSAFPLMVAASSEYEAQLGTHVFVNIKDSTAGGALGLGVDAGALTAFNRQGVVRVYTNTGLAAGKLAAEFSGHAAPNLLQVEDSTTSAVSTVLQLRHNSTGTPAAGFGTALELLGESSTTENRGLVKIDGHWVTATDGSRKAAGKLWAAFQGSWIEHFSWGPDASGNPQLAWFSATRAGKQTVSGSRGGNAALASLLTALATYGLITDSTSA